MAAITTIVAVSALAIAAGSAYQQSQAAKSAAKDRKEAGRVAQAEQAAQANQSRRAQVREERVRRATVLQSAQNTGVSQSSGEIGATSALGSLIGGNLASGSRQANSAAGIGSLSQSAANSDVRGAQWGAIGSFAGSVFGMAAGGMGGSGEAPVNAPVGQNSSPATVQPQRSIFG